MVWSRILLTSKTKRKFTQRTEENLSSSLVDWNRVGKGQRPPFFYFSISQFRHKVWGRPDRNERKSQEEESFIWFFIFPEKVLMMLVSFVGWIPRRVVSAKRQNLKRLLGCPSRRLFYKARHAWLSWPTFSTWALFCLFVSATSNIDDGVGGRPRVLCCSNEIARALNLGIRSRSIGTRSRIQYIWIFSFFLLFFSPFWIF